MPGGYTAFSVKHYKISAKYYTNKNCSENTTKLLNGKKTFFNNPKDVHFKRRNNESPLKHYTLSLEAIKARLSSYGYFVEHISGNVVFILKHSEPVR